MDSIIRIDQQGKVLLAPDAVGLCPEFNLLTPEQVIYLVLSYDCANTLFKQLPRDQWRDLSARHLYGVSFTGDLVEKEIPEEAIKKFRELVYDEEREWKHTLLEKISRLNRLIAEEEDNKKMAAYVATRKQVKDLLQEADEKISMTDEKIRLASKGRTLSTIERWQLRQKKFDKQ